MTPLDIHSMNPFRPPSWRGRRAAALYAGRLRATRFDDDWIRRGRRVLAALGRHGGDLGHPRVVAADPPVVGAYRLRADDDVQHRLEVEARLLAGQGDAAIADRVGIDAGVVAIYAMLFFDVRSSLEKVDWVASVVFGERLYDGRGAGDADLAAKLIAFDFGPLALDVLFGRVGEGKDANGLADALRRYAAIVTAPVTPETARRWMALAARQEELGREAAASAPVWGPVSPCR